MGCCKQGNILLYEPVFFVFMPETLYILTYILLSQLTLLCWRRTKLYRATQVFSYTPSSKEKKKDTKATTNLYQHRLNTLTLRQSVHTFP